MKKLRQRGIAFFVAMLLLMNVTPIWGAESTTVGSALTNYMNVRTLALMWG